MSPQPVQKSVPQELSGLRLDQALAQMFPDFSRSRLKEWLLDGAVTVDGGRWRPRDPVQGGEEICLNVRTAADTVDEPEAIELDIAYEDDSVIVVNKPAGLVVHPGAGNRQGTLVNGLLYRYPELRTLPRAGIVHRLDKDTSGLLLTGRTLAAHTALVRQLAERRILRRYDAVCCGVLTGGGKIDAAIRRHPRDRQRMAVQDDGKPAVTHYRVNTRYAAHTRVDVRLETGRTHQIRVHFAWKRHPLVGDRVYGGRLSLPAGCSEELASELRCFRRQALCALELGFAHPDHGRPVAVQIDPPRDYRRLLAVLDADLRGRES